MQVRVVHGLGRRAGWVGSGWVEILQFSMGWVEYDKSTIFFDDYTTYNCKGPSKLITRGSEKLAFLDQYLALFRKRYNIDRSYNG